MSEPRTAEGRKMLNDFSFGLGTEPIREISDRILAIEAEAATPDTRYSGLIATVQNATEQGFVVHLATRVTCAEHLEHGDDKATEPLTAASFPASPDTRLAEAWEQGYAARRDDERHATLDVERLARAIADEFDGWAKGSERYEAEKIAAAYSEASDEAPPSRDGNVPIPRPRPR